MILPQQETQLSYYKTQYAYTLFILLTSVKEKLHIRATCHIQTNIQTYKLMLFILVVDLMSVTFRKQPVVVERDRNGALF